MGLRWVLKKNDLNSALVTESRIITIWYLYFSYFTGTEFEKQTGAEFGKKTVDLDAMPATLRGGAYLVAFRAQEM